MGEDAVVVHTFHEGWAPLLRSALTYPKIFVLDFLQITQTSASEETMVMLSFVGTFAERKQTTIHARVYTVHSRAYLQ
jgi:hypothetical protein